MFLKGEEIKEMKEGKRIALGRVDCLYSQKCIHKACSRPLSPNCSHPGYSPLKGLILATVKCYLLYR